MNLEPFLDQKNTILTEKAVIFNKKIMVRSTLPYLHHWTGLRLILGVPALVV